MLAAIVAALLVGWRVWSDSRDGDRGPDPSSDQPRREAAVVSRVLDGDTVELADGTRVRLLGIDAPELARDGSDEEHYAKESTAELKRLLSIRNVTLESGPEAVDRYGRRLAWIITADEVLVNQQMLRLGAARLLDTFGLPARYEERLRAAESSARAERLGVWVTQRNTSAR